MTGSRVLVTGATGFMAGHCIRELLEYGYAVRGTVRDRRSADVAHLVQIARRAGGSFELAEASLDADAGWAAAVEGCRFVWHLASPVPAGLPKDENDVVRPAVDGTLRVLRAAAASVGTERVVIVSSTDAIVHGHQQRDRVLTEADWSVADRCAPYPKSKVLAERAAWEYVADKPLELVAINPGLVLGPLLHAERTTSMETIRLLLGHKLPAVPRLSFAVVDVRDVAHALLLATECQTAAGNRYITANAPMWMADIARTLDARFGPRGYNIPTRPLPHWAMWLGARFDKTVRSALTYWEVPVHVSAEKAARELGWLPRPPAESIIAAGESLIEQGIVRHPHGATIRKLAARMRRGRPRAPRTRAGRPSRAPR